MTVEKGSADGSPRNGKCGFIRVTCNQNAKSPGLLGFSAASQMESVWGQGTLNVEPGTPDQVRGKLLNRAKRYSTDPTCGRHLSKRRSSFDKSSIETMPANAKINTPTKTLSV